MTVPVYEGSLRILRSVRIPVGGELPPEVAENGELVLESEFHYQACDADVCYLPQSIPMRWKLQLDGHDLERVAEELRRAQD